MWNVAVTTEVSSLPARDFAARVLGDVWEKVRRRRNLVSRRSVGGKHGGQSGGEGQLSGKGHAVMTSFTGWRPQLKLQTSINFLFFVF